MRDAMRINVLVMLFAVFLLWGPAVADASPLTKKRAAAYTQLRAAHYCETSVPRRSHCRYRRLEWVAAKCTDIMTRRAGPWAFRRTDCLLRYMWANRRDSMALVFGCTMRVLQMDYLFMSASPPSGRCIDTSTRRPLPLLWAAKDGGGYYADSTP